MNSGERKPRVMVVAAECRPYAKVGGLGDMVALIIKELSHHNFDILLVLPGYEKTLAQFPDATEWHTDGYSDFNGSIFRADHGGIEIALIVGKTEFSPDDQPYTDASGFEHPDLAQRFADLCRGAALIERPDIIHLHDWHSCLTPLYTKSSHQIPVLLSVHNFAFQGRVSYSNAQALQIPQIYRSEQIPTFFGGISLLHLGMVLADTVTTVSADYASSLTHKTRYNWWYTPKCINVEQIVGIDNWIDTAAWRAEPALGVPFQFDANDLTRRNQNRRVLFQKIGWQDDDAPLFCTVSRITRQKGFGFLIRQVESLLSRGSRIIFVGNGNGKLLRRMHALEQRYPANVRLLSPYDENTARHVLAASDFCIMASLAEPCGLTQSHARSLGCIPIVSDAPGLRSTVQDGMTGFKFKVSDDQSFNDAVNRALQLRLSTSWQEMQRACMRREIDTSQIDKYADILNSLYLSKKSEQAFNAR
jgi:starch synthase